MDRMQSFMKYNIYKRVFYLFCLLLFKFLFFKSNRCPKNFFTFFFSIFECIPSLSNNLFLWDRVCHIK